MVQPEKMGTCLLFVKVKNICPVKTPPVIGRGYCLEKVASETSLKISQIDLLMYFTGTVAGRAEYFMFRFSPRMGQGDVLAQSS